MADFKRTVKSILLILFLSSNIKPLFSLFQSRLFAFSALSLAGSLAFSAAPVTYPLAVSDAFAIAVTVWWATCLASSDKVLTVCAVSLAHLIESLKAAAVPLITPVLSDLLLYRCLL